MSEAATNSGKGIILTFYRVVGQGADFAVVKQSLPGTVTAGCLLLRLALPQVSLCLVVCERRPVIQHAARPREHAQLCHSLQLPNQVCAVGCVLCPEVIELRFMIMGDDPEETRQDSVCPNALLILIGVGCQQRCGSVGIRSDISAECRMFRCLPIRHIPFRPLRIISSRTRCSAFPHFFYKVVSPLSCNQEI